MVIWFSREFSSIIWSRAAIYLRSITFNNPIHTVKWVNEGSTTSAVTATQSPHLAYFVCTLRHLTYKISANTLHRAACSKYTPSLKMHIL